MCQSQERKGSDESARTKEVHSKDQSTFVPSFAVYSNSYSFNPEYMLVHTFEFRLSVKLGCLIKQAGIIILNLWTTLPLGIEPVTSGLTRVYQTSSSTT